MNSPNFGGFVYDYSVDSMRIFVVGKNYNISEVYYHGEVDYLFVFIEIIVNINKKILNNIKYYHIN